MLSSGPEACPQLIGETARSAWTRRAEAWAFVHIPLAHTLPKDGDMNFASAGVRLPRDHRDAERSGNVRNRGK